MNTGDTNPSHYRLLARLWGRRRRHPDDPAGPLGAWDPTVCIVGDMKQSIYRFRQAEVSVMRRTDRADRRFNIDEGEPVFTTFVHRAWTRPTTRRGGGETGSFSNQHTGETSAPHTFVRFDEEDQPGRQPSLANACCDGPKGTLT